MGCALWLRGGQGWGDIDLVQHQSTPANVICEPWYDPTLPAGCGGEGELAGEPRRSTPARAWRWMIEMRAPTARNRYRVMWRLTHTILPFGPPIPVEVHSPLAAASTSEASDGASIGVLCPVDGPGRDRGWQGWVGSFRKGKAVG